MTKIEMQFMETLISAAVAVEKAAKQFSRPSHVHKPTVIKLTEGWVAQMGSVCGDASKTPELAMVSFDRKWRE